MLRHLPVFRGLAHFAARGHRMPTGVDAMLNRFTQLRRKEVINLCDGCRLGCVGDVEIKLPEGEVRALIVFGPCRFFRPVRQGRGLLHTLGVHTEIRGRHHFSSTSPFSAGTSRLTANTDAGMNRKKRQKL